MVFAIIYDIFQTNRLIDLKKIKERFCLLGESTMKVMVSRSPNLHHEQRNVVYFCREFRLRALAG